MKYRFIFLFFFASFASFSQGVTVRGAFLADSVKVGEQVAFYLSAHYPDSLTVVFPDTLHNFSPFEFKRKIYFSTRTTGHISADSTLYYLTTFDIDRLQSLRLPAYQVNDRDCTYYFSDADTILLTSLVTIKADTIPTRNLPFKETSAYQNVRMAFNYPVLVVAVAILIFTSLILYLLFGKRIRKHFRLKSLQKNYEQFNESFTGLLQQLQQAFSIQSAELAMVVWKKYMEQLESRPYTKLTTREMMQLMGDENLAKNLGAVDRVIYGHNTSVVESLENLQGIATEHFTKKLEEVKHG